MVKLTYKQRRELIKAIDEYGGFQKVVNNQTLPIEFVELALKYAHGLTEADFEDMPYSEMVEKAMDVFIDEIVKPEAEKKS
jgi:hypothetical protein